MSNYRFYCLDGDGRIGFAEWIKAGSDEEAISEAKSLRPDARRCEVWQQGRLVATLVNGSSSLSDGPRPS